MEQYIYIMSFFYILLISAVGMSVVISQIFILDVSAAVKILLCLSIVFLIDFLIIPFLFLGTFKIALLHSNWKRKHRKKTN